MKKTITAVYLIFSSFLLLSSCKKDTPSKEAVTIVGKWTMTEQGKDRNQNGKPDSGEMEAIAWGRETIDFKANKTVEFIHSGIGSAATGTTTYTYDNEKLVLTRNGITETVDILSLTKDNLTLRFNSGSYFGVYKR